MTYDQPRPLAPIPMDEELHYRIAWVHHVVERGDSPEAISQAKCDLADCVLARVEFVARPRLPISWVVRAHVLARDQFRCVECQATETLTIDHIVPHSKGGSDEEANLRTLCRRCNSKKGNRT